MKFFIDENISEYAGRMIAIFDRQNEVLVHGDHFEKGTADEQWLLALRTAEADDLRGVCDVAEGAADACSG